MSIAPQYKFKELSEGQKLVTPFGSYQVLGGIAFGRCCEVYEGVDTERGVAVALKVFRRHQEYRGALQRELFFLHTLAGPDAPIVQHIGEWQWLGRDILVQALLSRTLREVLLCHHDSTCSPWLITTLTKSLFRALKYLHEKGVVHADIKPPNILWDAESSCFKLIDFGVSFTTTEKFRHAIHSKGYQAPECVSWNKECGDVRQTLCALQRQPGPAADIWSAACVVAECFMGQQLLPVVYQKQEVAHTLRAALNSVSHRYPHIFLQEAYNFLSRCLCVEAEHRAVAGSLLGDPWLLYPHQPTLHDLVLLPTTVLRFMGVVDVDQHITSQHVQDVQSSYLGLCQKYGQVSGCQLHKSTGNIYIKFSVSQASQTARIKLNGSTFLGRTLVVTFYPLDSWTRKEFY